MTHFYVSIENFVVITLNPKEASIFVLKYIVGNLCPLTWEATASCIFHPKLLWSASLCGGMPVHSLGMRPQYGAHSGIEYLIQDLVISVYYCVTTLSYGTVVSSL